MDCSRKANHDTPTLVQERLYNFYCKAENPLKRLKCSYWLVLDEAGNFPKRVNTQMVDIERLSDAREIAELRALIQKHRDLTGSEPARRVLAAWETMGPRFVKLMPKDYKRVLACLQRAHDQGLSGDDAIMAAFEENARDLSRIGGN